LSGVRLTVHRATQEIGGNCIEIEADGARILLDVGRPLDAPREARGLLPKTLDLAAPVAGVLISHPHQDHYGLLDELPSEWPIYCGAATARLIELTTGIFGKPINRDFQSWVAGQALQVGPFKILPYLTDHSAFDAHMLLIEVAGKRILYSGDFRTHGRKSKLVEAMTRNPPADIDVLLMEGTNLGSDKLCVSERALEGQFQTLFRATLGRVFVAWSAQNIDRTVTLYRAAKQAGRTLVIDLYTAEVLETLRPFAKAPQPDWPNVKVVVTRAFAKLYRRKGQAEFVARMAANGISARALSKTRDRWVVMTRPSLIRDYEPAGVTPDKDDAWSWSMWRGYLSNPDGAAAQAWFDGGRAPAAHLHTSGHASPAQLRAFAQKSGAKRLVPIHGLAWDTHCDGFPPIERLADGQAYTV